MTKNNVRLLSILFIFMLGIFILSGCLAEGEAKESDKLTLNFGSMDGPPHVQNEHTFPYFAEKVDELTEGRVDFRMYMGGALGGASETQDNIVTGLMDVGRGINGYNSGKYEAHSVINLPFMAGATGEELSVVAQQLYNEFPEIQEEYWDVKLLWAHAADPYAIITKDKAVRSFEDVKGLRLRTPSEEGSLMIESWGATPVSLGAPEIYDAMQKGVIDGGVIPIAAIKDFNLTDVVDYVTIGYFNTNLFYVSMNQNSWDQLNEDEQEILEDELLGTPMAKEAGKVFDKQAMKAEEEAKAGGVEFIELPEEELEKFQTASEKIKEDWIHRMEDQGIDGRVIYERAEELIGEMGQ